MRVVVAHGRADERQRLTGLLERAGYETLEAAAASDALARCLEWAPDVAILEAELGDALLDRIKGDAHAFGTAVLLVVDRDPALEVALRASERGVQDILVAPVQAAELLLRVQAAGRTKVLQQEIVAQASRLETLIFEDALTGLPNRRFILTQLGALISGARRHGRVLTAAIVDVDHFKSINDRFGHAEGDRVLAAVARAMRAQLRAEDQLGRLGGEEFLALLPDTGAGDAQAAADKLRASAATAGVTVSVGWAAWEEEERGDALLHRADEALYAAKAGGRDRAIGAPATLPRRR